MTLERDGDSMLNQVLKDLRKQHGITQEQLAGIVRVERSSIGKYESPTKPVIPSRDILIRISDYFDVSLDVLLGKKTIQTDDLTPKGSQKEQAILDGQPVTPGQQKIIEAMQGATAEEEQQALAFVEFLKSQRKQGP
jgi:transcriptional regulator with XRE-family HTH domain